MKVKKGDKIVRIMTVNGISRACLSEVSAVDKKRGIFSTDDGVSKPSEIEDRGVQTYYIDSGLAVCNYIPGCSSKAMELEQ